MIFQNQGKYPFFNVSGCAAGNFYSFDPTRLTGNSSISENFELTKERGSIGFLADTHLGIATFLDSFNIKFYQNFCQAMYGNTVGNQLKQVVNSLSWSASSDYYRRITLEELALDGDPALHIFNSSLPDYAIEDQYVKISPSIISAADNSFNINVSWMNIGRAVDDSMLVTINRKLPNGVLQVLYSKEIPATKYVDSVSINVPINPLTDIGTNQIIVTLDANQQINELSELNNSITKSFDIFQDELRPVFPYNYSIINNQNITYTASTANPLSGQRQYLMEIDTTALFNSPFKKQYTANAPGGIVQFTSPAILFTDSTVYYWRTAMVPLASEPLIWNSFSFIYLNSGGAGFNQSHYYQHLQSTYNNINLDSDRVFRFTTTPRNLIIHTGLYPYFDYDRINVYLDYTQLDYYGCKYNSLQFMVYDSNTLMPWQNYNVNATNGDLEAQ
ncbi:MAG: C25 family cysteine peptidase [Ferruginibacter sp.]